MPCLSSPEAAPATPSCAAPKPLTIACDRCEDGTRWTSRFGGNDPDVWPVGRCETCDGTGLRTLCCDGCSDPEAVEWFQGGKWCAACAIIAKEDALVAGED